MVKRRGVPEIPTKLPTVIFNFRNHGKIQSIFYRGHVGFQWKILCKLNYCNE